MDFVNLSELRQRSEKPFLPRCVATNLEGSKANSSGLECLVPFVPLNQFQYSLCKFQVLKYSVWEDRSASTDSLCKWAKHRKAVMSY
jgi:hypothetical protein